MSPDPSKNVLWAAWRDVKPHHAARVATHWSYARGAQLHACVLYVGASESEARDCAEAYGTAMFSHVPFELRDVHHGPMLGSSWSVDRALLTELRRVAQGATLPELQRLATDTLNALEWDAGWCPTCAGRDGIARLLGVKREVLWP